MAKAAGNKKRNARSSETVTREYTINLGRATHKQTHKTRARRCISTIKAFAQKTMRTKDVRVDVGLNQFIQSKGIRHVPRKVRVRLERRRNDNDEAEEKLYTYATVVKMDGTAGEWKNLLTKKIE